MSHQTPEYTMSAEQTAELVKASLPMSAKAHDKADDKAVGRTERKIQYLAAKQKRLEATLEAFELINKGKSVPKELRDIVGFIPGEQSSLGKKAGVRLNWPFTVEELLQTDEDLAWQEVLMGRLMEVEVLKSDEEEGDSDWDCT